MRTTPRSTGSATPVISPLSSMPTTPSKLFTNLSSSGYFSTSVSPTRSGIDSDSILDLPQFAASSSSSSASSTSSPRSDFFDNHLGSYDLGLDALTLDSHLNKLYSTNLFEPFLEQSFTSPSPEQSGLLSGDFGWTEGQDFYSNYSTLTADELAYVSSLDAGTQPYPTQFSDNILMATPSAHLDNISNISVSHAPCTSIDSSSAPFPTTRPSPSDLQQYRKYHLLTSLRVNRSLMFDQCTYSSQHFRRKSPYCIHRRGRSMVNRLSSFSLCRHAARCS